MAINWKRYPTRGRYDELMEAAGRPRAVAANLVEYLGALDRDELRSLQAAAELSIKEMGITFIGLRPGEKLVEELIGRHEQSISTSHPKIIALKNHPREWFSLHQEVETLEKLAAAMDWQGLKTHLQTFYQKN